MAKSETEDTSQTASISGSQAKRGIPRQSLKEVAEWAKKLWADAKFGTTPHDAFAKSLGHQAAEGGAWRAKMAAIRAYGLVRETRGNPTEIGLSDVGKNLVREDDKTVQKQARRDAFMGVGAFREILQDSAGAHLPGEAALASKFEFKWGLNRSDAEEAARNLVESARFAGLVEEDSGGLLVQQIAVDSDGGDTETESLDQSLDGEKASGGEEGASAPKDPGESGGGSGSGGSLVGGLRGTVNLSVSLDLSQFDAEDVLRILAALGLTNDGDSVAS